MTSVAVAGVAWKLGYDAGRGEGYRAGFRAGEVHMARAGPPQVRNEELPRAALSDTPAWRALGPLSDVEAAGLTELLNRAPSPCFEEARRGLSLASTLLRGAAGCSTAPDQVRLGLAALRSFDRDLEEALAVLRVERRVGIGVDGRPARGNAAAGVTLVEWGDYQCPYCAQVRDVLDRLLEQRGDVRLVFKHLPLSFHPASRPAALAAEAAAEQGRFWEMHDALLDLGADLDESITAAPRVPGSDPVPFERLAFDLGLNVERFRADYRSPGVARRVDDDLAEARRLGVEATPTLFVDTRRVVEPVSVELLARLVDKARGERAWRFSWDLEPASALAGAEPAAANVVASP